LAGNFFLCFEQQLPAIEQQLASNFFYVLNSNFSAILFSQIIFDISDNSWFISGNSCLKNIAD